ncbi:hypothetical protein CL616_04425 [archaeon]|nr:hypothetical protein [archaeon]|tara:strand:- start:71 stop:757 length:687 start_codon:yes stop_codon:yes gene_type:complete
MFSKEDPISSAAEGATQGFLNWGKEEIKNWITKFKNRDLAFVNDNETIELVKEQRETGEWDLFKQYIKNKDYRILFQMGLSLRKLEKENKPYEPLKKKILKKYGRKGLQIAHFVQNKLFSRFYANLLERVNSSKQISLEIAEFLENLEKTVVFVSNVDKIETKTSEIIAKIQSGSPETFIISSSGSAKDACDTIKFQVIQKIDNYTYEEYNAPDKKIYFLNRVEELLN